jgi:hypothetical protein
MQAIETAKRAPVLPGGQIPNLIHDALARMLGAANAEAIEFYIDSRLAVDDPARYETYVKLLLGEHGGSLVIAAIKNELARRSGLDRSTDSFLGQVKAVENALLRSALV